MQGLHMPAKQGLKSKLMRDSYDALNTLLECLLRFPSLLTADKAGYTSLKLWLSDMKFGVFSTPFCLLVDHSI